MQNAHTFVLARQFHVGAPLYFGNNFLLCRWHLRYNGMCTEKRHFGQRCVCIRIPWLARLAQLLVNAEQKCQKQCYIAEIFVPRDLRRNNSPLAWGLGCLGDRIDDRSISIQIGRSVPRNSHLNVWGFNGVLSKLKGTSVPSLWVSCRHSDMRLTSAAALGISDRRIYSLPMLVLAIIPHTLFWTLSVRAERANRARRARQRHVQWPGRFRLRPKLPHGIQTKQRPLGDAALVRHHLEVRRWPSHCSIAVSTIPHTTDQCIRSSK